MRLFALSDIHVDYPDNMAWLLALSDSDYQEDLLLLAGDVSDLPDHLVTAFDRLRRKFREVFFVPGNHELWVHRCGTGDSMVKFDRVMKLAREHGIQTDPWQDEAISIVPMLGWYDYSFGLPGDQLKESWFDFYACRWPRGWDLSAITDHFLRQNAQVLEARDKPVVSFSHFLPRIDVMPEAIPASYRYLYPVLGSNALGEQVRRLRPDLHVYGHSHVNRRVAIDGIEYLNNAFGYPSESGMTRRRLVCVYDDQALDRVAL